MVQLKVGTRSMNQGVLIKSATAWWRLRQLFSPNLRGFHEICEIPIGSLRIFGGRNSILGKIQWIQTVHWLNCKNHKTIAILLSLRLGPSHCCLSACHCSSACHLSVTSLICCCYCRCGDPYWLKEGWWWWGCEVKSILRVEWERMARMSRWKSKVSRDDEFQEWATEVSTILYISNGDKEHQHCHPQTNK